MTERDKLSGYRDIWMVGSKVKVLDLSNVSNYDFVLDYFNIYPNPAKDKVTVNLENNLVFQCAVLYNNLGQIVKKSEDKIIDISTLAKGLYYIEVITDKGKATKKINCKIVLDMKKHIIYLCSFLLVGFVFNVIQQQIQKKYILVILQQMGLRI